MKEQMASQNSDQIRDDDLETKISSNEECVSLSKPSGLRFFFLKNPGPLVSLERTIVLNNIRSIIIKHHASSAVPRGGVVDVADGRGRGGVGPSALTMATFARSDDHHEENNYLA